MTTTEKNAVIAMFMGLEISISPVDGYDYGTWYKPSDIQGEVIPSPVLYHSDYNWIMPVVEKIRSTQECSDFNINFSCDCKIECEDYGMVFEEYCSNKVDTLQATYNACFQFIQWYNQQTQNP